MKNKYTSIGCVTAAFLLNSLPASAYSIINTGIEGMSAINNNETVFIQSFVLPGNTLDVYDIKTGETTALYRGVGYSNYVQTNNLGDAVWYQELDLPVLPNGNLPGALLRYSGDTQEISHLSSEGATPGNFDVNKDGDVIWVESQLVSSNPNVYSYEMRKFYSGSEETKSFLGSDSFSPSIAHFSTVMNDRGSVAWISYDDNGPKYNNEIFFKKDRGSDPVSITGPGVDGVSLFNVAINDSNEMVFVHRFRTSVKTDPRPCSIEKRNENGKLLARFAEFSDCPSIYELRILDNGDVVYLWSGSSRTGTSGIRELHYYDTKTGVDTKLDENTYHSFSNKKGDVIWKKTLPSPAYTDTIFIRHAATGLIETVAEGLGGSYLGAISDKGDIAFTAYDPTQIPAVYTMRLALNTMSPPVDPGPQPAEMDLSFSVNRLNIDTDKETFATEVVYDLGAGAVTREDMVIISVDGVTLFSESLSLIDENDGVYSVNNNATRFELDTDKSRIVLKLDGFDTLGISARDGLVFMLQIGNNSAKSTFMLPD